MAKTIEQLCFFGDESIEFEENGYSTNLINGKNVIQLGIYAVPGTKFRINQIDSDNSKDLIINGSGIFSMNIENRPITKLSIFKNSFENIANSQHQIIIDLITEEVLGVE